MCDWTYKSKNRTHNQLFIISKYCFYQTVGSVIIIRHGGMGGKLDIKKTHTNTNDVEKQNDSNVNTVATGLTFV